LGSNAGNEDWDEAENSFARKIACRVKERCKEKLSSRCFGDAEKA
jgi:hypothetical protein